MYVYVYVCMSSNNIWSFHAVVVQGRAAKKCTKKRDAPVKLLFC